MRVVFLDVDGVLTHNGYINWQTRHINPAKVGLLGKIIEQTGAAIVLTSTWKDGWDKENGTKEDYYVILENVLAKYGLEIYDITSCAKNACDFSRERNWRRVFRSQKSFFLHINPRK